ncbi:MAG: class I SAM-dependent methyltransferase [Chloroflexota bacterium]
MNLIEPRSVVDVGCGLGTWLSVFREQGVDDVIGVDGEYVRTELLQIPSENFLRYDLTRALILDRTFDLVVSLEVAEHLPSNSAEAFVESLTLLGPVILFSAAIPRQGGANHVNEQWPEYWIQLFDSRGYACLDPIRPHIWLKEDIEPWYIQNAFLYVERAYLESNQALKAVQPDDLSYPLSIVHRRLYLELARSSDVKRIGIKASLRGLVWGIKTALENAGRNDTLQHLPPDR